MCHAGTFKLVLHHPFSLSNLPTCCCAEQLTATVLNVKNQSSMFARSWEQLMVNNDGSDSHGCMVLHVVVTRTGPKHMRSATCLRLTCLNDLSFTFLPLNPIITQSTRAAKLKVLGEQLVNNMTACCKVHEVQHLASIRSWVCASDT